MRLLIKLIFGLFNSKSYDQRVVLSLFSFSAWYPLGRIVGGTVYPGLMVTSGSIHYILSLLNIPIHIRDICVFLAPVFRY